jgi:hypothetical protein
MRLTPETYFFVIVLFLTTKNAVLHMYFVLFRQCLSVIQILKSKKKNNGKKRYIFSSFQKASKIQIEEKKSVFLSKAKLWTISKLKMLEALKSKVPKSEILNFFLGFDWFSVKKTTN